MKATKLKPLCGSLRLLFLAAGSVACSGGAFGQATTSNDQAQEIQLLKQQMEVLNKKLDALTARQAQSASSQQVANPGVVSASTNTNASAGPGTSASSGVQQTSDADASSGWGAGMPPRLKSLLAALGDMEFYGNLDLSVDYATKGLSSSYVTPGGTVVSPQGHMGWQPDISTNLSYVGIRGKRPFGSSGLSFVYQLETQLDISATAGTSNSNSAQDSTVKGALTSRNSFIGVDSSKWGALKIGKTDAPYKTSTARMNPFSGTWGDYSIIMGNTGGDNRVEFGTRLDHAIWYESPSFHGWSFNALVSPGQNRGFENSVQAAGESNCTGGNVPGSGGNPIACNDGSYGSAYSANLAYTNGPLYFTTAYELHRDVNRSSDVTNSPAALASPDGTDPNDIGNEWAFKVGAQYKLPTLTTVSAIFEVMRRNIPAYLQSQNERSRNGFWLAVTQEFTPKDTASVGWAHAGRTPGDPGQHNTAPADPNAIGIPNPSNGANMLTAMYRHSVDKHATLYAVYAVAFNQQLGHYALGAGGRAVSIDCHDGSSISNGAPFCYAGGRPMGFSVGLNYKF
ncbi:putative porin [Paraburkholderia sp. GAS448]|uniref:porin n=1 Tax=Paraburkholderia sp. GAS448 TaxID=3035136 RepID=UPI003D1C1880